MRSKAPSHRIEDVRPFSRGSIASAFGGDELTATTTMHRSQRTDAFRWGLLPGRRGSVHRGRNAEPSSWEKGEGFRIAGVRVAGYADPGSLWRTR